VNIQLEQKQEKIYLKVNLPFRGKRGKGKSFSTADAINWIKTNHTDVKLGKIVSSPPKALNNLKRLQGEWIFELEKEKPLDIPVNYVKINIPIVEAEFPPLVDKEEEPKEEKASLSSEELPNGFKKVKRKRTKKKKTEE
jgi:hypothetical protein